MVTPGWRALPALRHALAFATGILIADACDLPPAALFAGLGAASLMLGVAITRTPGRAQRVAIGAVVAFIVSASGLTLRTLDRLAQELHSNIRVLRVELIGWVAGDPVNRGGSLTFEVLADSIVLRNRVVRAARRVLVHARSDASRRLDLNDGAGIAVVGTLRSPSGPRYPGGFDEREWLETRGIGLVLEASSYGAVLGFAAPRPTWAEYALSSVRETMRTFATEEVGGEEGEIVRALMLGERSGIDRETRDAFARTGTIHVLAVSGLHVSLIAAGLAVFVSWLRDRRLRLLAFVLMLGGYAVVAGAGSSIVRAWCMASAMMLGAIAGRQTSTLNLLGVAAIVILVASPAELYSPGFQLSFVAVAGIALLYHRCHQWCRARFPRLMERSIAAWIASALALTFSAQLLTAPLLLLHFGSVPILGLLLNLAVVPLTSLALGASFAGAAVTWLEPISSAYGAAAWCAVRAARLLVQVGANAPYAAIGSWWTTWPVAALLALFILYAIAARSARSFAMRLALAVWLTLPLLQLQRWRDRLTLNGAARVYILGSRHGTVFAVQRGNLLTAYSCDGDPEGSISRTLTTLGWRVGAEVTGHANLRNLDSVPGHLARLDAETWLMADPPLIITSSRLRAPRVVRLGELRALLVSTRLRPSRAIILDHRNSWTRKKWH